MRADRSDTDAGSDIAIVTADAAVAVAPVQAPGRAGAIALSRDRTSLVLGLTRACEGLGPLER